MIQLVLLQDVVATHGSNWLRVAVTQGIEEVKVGDRFRERGFGPGSEELQVGGVDISPVGGYSRLYFQRAANNTQPRPYRLGAILEPVVFIPAVGEPNPIYATQATATASLSNQPLNGVASAAGDPLDEDFPPPQNLISAHPTKKSSAAVRQKRFRERKKLANSQHH